MFPLWKTPPPSITHFSPPTPALLPALPSPPLLLLLTSAWHTFQSTSWWILRLSLKRKTFPSSSYSRHFLIHTHTHARTRSVLVAIWQGVREQPWAAPPVDYEGLRTNTYRRERRNWTLELPVTGLPPPPSNRGVCSQWIADPSHTNTHLHWGSTSEKNDIRATLWRLCDYITWMMFFKQIPEI